MKAHFSADGAYLHLASLEAQEISKSKSSKSKSSSNGTKNDKADKAKPKVSLQLSLLVSTHRLSLRKTTRSPPKMIHCAKLSLGSSNSLSVAQMPISISWTSTHLYCTVSSNSFRVYRVALFQTSQSANHSSTVDGLGTQPQLNSNVAVPKNETLLPDSSRVREVRYYPPTSEEASGIILIGSLNPTSHRRIKELSDTEHENHDEGLPDVTSPPIGLFVKADDLGGWVSEEGREAELKGRHGRSGGLERRVEQFDAEDDCKSHICCPLSLCQKETTDVVIQAILRYTYLNYGSTVIIR